MSGGEFDYIQYRIQSAADQLSTKIDEIAAVPFDERNDWSKYSDATMTEFKNGLRLLREAEVYLHRIDWLMSGDDGEETFHTRLKDDLEKLKNE